jgi:FAD/FMN-containing dehydrogenase
MVSQLAPPTSSVDLDDEAVGALAADLRGRLLRPADEGYDAARAIWNAMIDRRPALIARCAGVADVIGAVTFARSNGLPVAVRGGGHNVAGTAICDGGLVVDVSPMTGIRVDPVARTARAEGGATWGELDQEAQAFGLATTGGVIPTTGIAGLSLGGGLGWLMRSFGLSCDNLLSADVVTADGRFLTANATQHPDLFWALRGGGGNFGVVTSLEFKLHEVGPNLVAGPLFHPLATAREVLRHYRDVAPTFPDELICHAGLLTSPDGAALAALIPAYVGPIAAGEAAVRPLREFGPPVADLAGPMPYRTLQTLFNAAFPHGRRNYWKSAFLQALDDDAIDLMVDGYARAPSPYAVVFIEQLGGQVGRVGPDETAFAHRSAPYNLMVLSAWDDPADDETNLGWVRDVWATLRRHTGGGVYVNYLSDARYEGENRVRSAYGPNYDRLAAVKRTYDPTNVFRFNHNIAPAG